MRTPNSSFPDPPRAYPSDDRLGIAAVRVLVEDLGLSTLDAPTYPGMPTFFLLSSAGWFAKT
jgi:hypothetical protein